MSILDELNLHHQVSVAIMPCGTGNDLGRVLGWGHKYTQEPVEKYLNKVLRGKIRQLDRSVIVFYSYCSQIYVNLYYVIQDGL